MMRRVTAALGCSLGLLGLWHPETQPGHQTSGRQHVSRGLLIAAMRTQVGYKLSATTNGARFESAVFLELARAASLAAPNGEPMYISRVDWVAALREVTGLRVEELSPATRLVYEYRQDVQIEYRREKVIRAVRRGPQPRQALAVRHEWPADTGRPERFSYEDTLTSPRLRVTNRRVIEYKLLSVDKMVVYDEINGFSARPTSGLLGALFNVLGEAEVVHARHAIAAEGTMVTRVDVRKLLAKTFTATVRANGDSENGVPSGRRDLQAAATALKADVDIDYWPARP